MKMRVSEMVKMRVSEMVMAAAVAIGLLGIVLPMAMAGVTDTPMARLSVQEAAQWGATHCLTLDYNSFKGLTTSTNTTTVITNALPAGSLVRFELMKLDQAWDCATYTDSLLMYSGWAADTDGFMESTETAADGTEVFGAVTPIVLEQGAYGIGGTNTLTNITYKAHGWQYFAAATNILTTVKQNSHGSCISSNTAGKVRFFYRIITP